VWLVFYKKTSGRQTVAYKDALQDALCYGWIDSRVKSMDADRFTVRFTPRKPGSPWSKRNLKLVEALLQSGRMTKAGIGVLPIRLGGGRQALRSNRATRHSPSSSIPLLP
jgi:uncharacterized protein YdeI (YjbR/CyaY-like superfamily)